MMRRALLLLLLFGLLLVGPTAVRYFQFYGLAGAAERSVPTYDPVNIPTVPTPAANGFVDEPEPGSGLVLLDMAHNNQVALEEISFLDGRLAARGFDLVPFDGGDLATTLRSANAFIVMTPVVSYSEPELLAVRRFVDRGGRLLLVGDPARFSLEVEEDPFLGLSFAIETDKLPLNSLANAFDIVYNGDYLYNTLENEGNFRNIILQEKGFAEAAVTENVSQLAFYGSHSLQVGPSGTPLLQGDDNTWSSATDRPGGLTLAASSHEGQVLALGDINFLTAPYYAVYDNSQFIANVADFLTDTTERGLVLADFPYFFQTAVNLTYTGDPELGAGAFDEIIALQDAFRRAGQSLNLADEPDSAADTLYLGLYNQADELADLLDDAGVTLLIDPPLPEMEPADEVEADEEMEADEAEAARLIQSKLGSVEMAGTALLLLHEVGGQRQLVVLAASAQGLENVVYRLVEMVPLNADYALSDCLLQENLALCPTGVPNEPVEAVLETTVDSSETPDAEGGGVEPGAEPPDATPQGEIGLGETKTAVLEANEQHAWIFNQGPGFIDIEVVAAEFDAVLEVVDSDNNTIAYGDQAFSGAGEQLFGVDIEDAGDYAILVRGYADGSGSYDLTVSEGSEPVSVPGVDIDTVFVFGDDDGEPLADGSVSVAALTALLEESYTVTSWLSSTDGTLTADVLSGHDLLIWDSGDFRDEEPFASPDADAIFQFLDEGGHMLVIGASPTLLGPIELSPLAEVVVTGDDPLLTAGFAPGEVIVLTETLETAVSDLLSPGPTDVPFLQRSPDDALADELVGVASIDEFGGNRTAFLLLRFTSLPEEVQPLLLNNILTWFAAES